MTISAPSERIKFKLREVSFNYIGGNNDDRVRVFGDNCIIHYDHKILSDKTSRQSFVCESEREANEVIAAFRFLKKSFPGDPLSLQSGNKKLKISDSTFGTKTLSEAINFINDRLSYSIILGIDKTGMITLNAPEEIYRFKIKEVKISKTDHRNISSDWFNIPIPGDYSPGILVECNDCI